MNAASTESSGNTASSHRKVDLNDIVWTPEHVIVACHLQDTPKLAWAWLRRAGAEKAGTNGRSLRLTREAFLRWLDRNSKSSKAS